MYIEEQMIDGVLCVRYGPDDEFRPYTLDHLSKRVVHAEKQLQEIRWIVQ